MSQPAITKSVRRMEELVGFPLFQRGSGPAQPTPEALNLFREVEKVFHTVSVVEKYARDLKDSQSGVLTLACTPTMSCGFLTEAIARFRRERPRVRIWLHITKTKEVLELAANGQIDLGLIYTPGEHAAVRAIPLFETALVCIMPPDHPLAAKTSIRPQDLKDQAIITNVRNDPIHDLLGAAFGKMDLDRQVLIGTNSTITTCALVLTGSGVGIVEPMGVREVFPQIVLREFRPRVAIHPRVVHSRHVTMSRLCHSFVEILLDEAAMGTPN
jgi:DNA-binding transcriptional LysR family regulator